jgi:hypothetical protein
MKISRTGFWLFCSLILLAMAACTDTTSSAGNGAGGGSSLELGAESPQALATRIQQAAQDKDLREFFASIFADDLATMIEELPGFAAMMMAFSFDADPDMSFAEAEAAMEKELAPLNAKLDAIMTRYGLPAISDEGATENESELENSIAEMEQDAMVELLVELVNFMDDLPLDDDGDDFSSQLLDSFDGTLTDLKMEDDRASAMINDMPIEFVLVNGRWFLREIEG